MVLNENITKDAIQDLVETVVATNAYHAWSDADCLVEVDVIENEEGFMPVLTIDTNDDAIALTSQTVELTEGSESIGWTFDITMTAQAETIVLDGQTGSDAAIERYEHYMQVAKLAKQLAETTIIPGEYFE